MNPLDVAAHKGQVKRTFYKVEDAETIREALLEKGANYYFPVHTISHYWANYWLIKRNQRISPGEPAVWGHHDQADADLRKRRREFREAVPRQLICLKGH